MNRCDKCWGTGEAINHAELGRLLRDLRVARGRSLKTQAARLGISVSFLCLLEQGKRSWPEQLVQKAKADDEKVVA